MKPITVYTKVPCPYCVNAKRLLTELNLPFQEIDLTQDLSQLDVIKQKYQWKTVPLILIGDRLVGGYTDLKSLHESGALKDWLA